MPTKTTPAMPVDEGKHKPDAGGLQDLKEGLSDTGPVTGPADENKRTPGRPPGRKSKPGSRKTGPKAKGKPASDRPGESAAKPAPEIETIDKFEGKHFAPFCKLVFDLIASRLGKQWKLNRGEIAELSVASADLANKRLPNLAQYSAELNFALVLTAIAYPRLEGAQKQ